MECTVRILFTRITKLIHVYVIVYSRLHSLFHIDFAGVETEYVVYACKAVMFTNLVVNGAVK